MEQGADSKKTFEVLVKFFQNDGWKFSQQAEKLLIQMNCTSNHGSYACFAHVVAHRPVAQFFSIAGVRVPEEKRPAMAEFLTRANYGILIGNFEMDYSDGEVRYKTNIDVRDGELTAEMVKGLVQANIVTMDRYFPGMLAVLSSDVSPKIAVAKIEGTIPAVFPWESAGARRFG